VSHYYATTYVGTGADGDEFRPFGADGVDGWQSIDLRPNPEVPTGYCLLATPAPLPTAAGRLYLGESTGPVSAQIRNALSARLGITLTATTLEGAVVEILTVYGTTDGSRWRPLQAGRDSWNVQLGDLKWERPVVAGGSVIVEGFNKVDSLVSGADTFDRADAASLGANWTAVYGSASIVTNQASMIESFQRFDAIAATTDQETVVTVSGSGIGPAVRFDPASTGIGNVTMYRFFYDQNGYWAIQKWVNGATSTPATFTEAAPAYPQTLTLRMIGNTLHAYAGTVKKISVTDSTNPLTSGRGGIASVAAATVTADNFTARSLDPVGPDQTWTQTFTSTTDRIADVRDRMLWQRLAGNTRWRAEADLASANHYAQAQWQGTTVSNNGMGLLVRHSATADTCYMGRRYQGTTIGTGIYKIVNGTFTNLSNFAAVSDLSQGPLIKMTADGSTLTLTTGGYVDSTVTDTSLTTERRTGVYLISAGTDRSKLDNFQAADLSEPIPSGPRFLQSSQGFNTTATTAPHVAETRLYPHVGTVLIAHLVTADNSNTGHTGTTGWTKIAGQNASAQAGTSMWWRRSDPSVSLHTWTIPASSIRHLVVYEFAGVDTLAAIVAVASALDAGTSVTTGTVANGGAAAATFAAFGMSGSNGGATIASPFASLDNNNRQVAGYVIETDPQTASARSATATWPTTTRWAATGAGLKGSGVTPNWVFRLTVTDNEGASNTSQQTTTIGASPATTVTAATASLVGTAQTSSAVSVITGGTAATASLVGTAQTATRTAGAVTLVAVQASLVGTAQTALRTVTVTLTAAAATLTGTAQTASRAVNAPPTVVATASPNPAGQTATITLDGSGSSDPEGAIVTYLWEQVSGPPGTITNPNAAVTTFVPSP
jgi:hypothetical protein